jgi:hypothetical protein
MRTGIKRYFRVKRNNGKFVFDSELGHPLFENTSIPMLTESHWTEWSAIRLSLRKDYRGYRDANGQPRLAASS